MSKYTAKDHAFIYGVIAQSALELFPDCKPALIEGIQVYGLQRGSRMGQLADTFGDERSMQHYMAYGEWAPAPGEMDIEIPQVSPSAVWHVKKCPWSQEWKEKGMLEVGQLYCKYVDRELVHGFCRDLDLGIGTTQTAGDDYCYFCWTGADMTLEHQQENKEIQSRIGNSKIRPWAYHMSHLYKTMGECLEKQLGQKEKEQIYRKADEKIQEAYGESCVKMLHAGLLLDYWVTPGLKETELLSELF
jgi:hypothetical protein